MRIAVIGQKDFGKASLEAFADRGDTIAGVFCAPEKAGAPPDPLVQAAEQRGIRVFRLPNLKSEEAREVLRSLGADVGIMAFVLQFVPQEFAQIPRFGTLGFHPSLLPRYRGPSSINWPIILGDSGTGLTIFRPSDGLDEGAIVLQKETPIAPDDTLGKVYFERLFPMGVAALLEAADLVASGKSAERVQDESQASYEGWCRAAEARIHWQLHGEQIYNLIRGCDPSPGAWTTAGGRKLQLFAARKHPVRTFGQVQGAGGAIASIGEQSMFVSAQGAQIEIGTVRPEDGKKMSAAQFCAQAGLKAGAVLGAG
jgi:methionyl-tRNA formyltransferase